MIALRKLFQVFGRGTRSSSPREPQILAYIREYKRDDGSSESRDRPLRRQPLPLRPARLARPQRFAGMVPVEMLGARLQHRRRSRRHYRQLSAEYPRETHDSRGSRRAP
jgi:hypothetical protein